MAQSFHCAVAMATQQQQQPVGPGGRPPAGGRRQAGAGSGSSLEAFLRQARVPYYGHCEVFIWKNSIKVGWSFVPWTSACRATTSVGI